MTALGDAPNVHADDRATWRAWLALDARPAAAANFAAFPPSTRKQLLGWVATAVRPATRAARIAKVAEAAARNERSPSSGS